MTTLTIISTTAIIVGLAGVLPQIHLMWSAQRADGQAPLGWLLGISVNLMMGYVNLFGYGAKLLALGNLLGASLSLLALLLVLRLRDRGHQQAPVALASASPVVSDLATCEFDALAETVVAEARRRERPLALAS